MNEWVDAILSGYESMTSFSVLYICMGWLFSTPSDHPNNYFVLLDAYIPTIYCTLSTLYLAG